ncbi:MAG TPA: polyketide synthase, partial [Thermoanaerobaculia bacterium]|nr:polyketide synthase [Thermoanaerobaculia bacterium]
ERKEYCALGSVKSNIGHCLTAAGVAGVIKILLALQHRKLPPTINFERLNEHIDLADSPFYVNTRLQEWDLRDAPRRQAAISSFGFSGTNAHLVLGEYPAAVESAPPVPLSTPNGKIIIPLSARTAEQLRQKARDLLDFVRRPTLSVDLIRMAYTLQVGRDAMDERLGLVVSSVEDLAGKLEAYVHGESKIADLHEGQVKRGKESLSVISRDHDVREAITGTLIANRKLSGLLELWVRGLEVDWNKLYGEAKPLRMSLPLYPFAKERYWIDPAAGQPAATLHLLHPLLHRNTSDLYEQRYVSTFTGEEPFFLDAQLPGAVYLEMARAAIADALPAQPESTVLELRDTVWLQPILVAGPTEVSIALLSSGDDQIDYEIYSGEAGQETVHCHGRALFSNEPAPAALDLGRLQEQLGSGQKGKDQLLVSLRLPAAVEDVPGDYVLHPMLVGGALSGAVELLGSGQSRLPIALETLRVLAPCARAMVAWARFSPGSQAGDGTARLDIDLCDERGNICAQISGVSWQPTSTQRVEPVMQQAAALSEQATPAQPVRKEIALLPLSEAIPGSGARRTQAIALAEPIASSAAASSANTPQPSAARPLVALANVAIGIPTVSRVQLYDGGNGIFSIEIGESTSHDMIGGLVRALERVQQEASLKVLTLSGIEHCFGRGGRDDYNEAIEQQLYHALATFSYPSIAILRYDAIGAAFMAAALCDFMVCSEDAYYGYTDAERHIYPTAAEMVLFDERFGEIRARDLLFLSSASTGRQLLAKGWTCPILPEEQVKAHAQQLASRLAAKSQDALRLLKQHLARRLAGLVDALTHVEIDAAAKEDSNTAADAVGSPAEYIHLDSPVEQVLLIRFGLAGTQADVRELFAALGSVIEQSQQIPCYKAIVLVSDDADFLPGEEHAIPPDVVLDVQRLVDRSDIPIIAAVTGNARGQAWLIAQCFDAAVYNREGIYSAESIRHHPVLARTTAAMFAHRFGFEAAGEILLSGADYSGLDLQRRADTITAVEHDQVISAAIDAATSLASLPRATLVAWKKHTVTTLQEKVRGMGASSGSEEEDETPEQLPVTPTPIAFQSRVVTATAHPDGIVVVKMEDRAAKNMFSDAFVEGVAEAFAHIAKTSAYKVVILTGYENYFVSGGTKEGLVAIQQGKARFTDSDIYQVALDCKLPVIAAMQGHGIGAGWSLGMFADIVLLSEESRYVSPYMDYGFTPGAGATYILAEKIGQDLARESLLAAHSFAGNELKKRGLRLPVVPRDEVYPAAMALAKQIARASRARLTTLKELLTSRIHQALEEIYRLEVAMHEATFVGRPDTLELIQARFAQEIETPRATPQQVPAERRTRSADGDGLHAVRTTLRGLLASELGLRESDIEDDVEFVHLGLDSISAATWMRRINGEYQTSIEATKFYQYPTLAQLSAFVKEEAEKHGVLRGAGAIGPTDAYAASPGAGLSLQETAIRLPVSKQGGRRNRSVPRLTGSARPVQAPDAIAVIGMSGRFPQARNLEEYWQNLAQGKNCIAEVPPSRWNVKPSGSEPTRKDKLHSQWLGMLDDVDGFDPLFFRIAPEEADYMDPQHRLFLQESYRAIEDAGYAGSISSSKCGVYLGISNNDYGMLLLKHGIQSPPVTSNSFAIAAARIAYHLNLKGPALSVDTACSSSLVAIHLACQGLLSGETDMALAGGVALWLTPESHFSMSEAGMLSPVGQCKAFDDSADGIVVGEGVGALVLKRLRDAEADGDFIHGVILGSGINQDGRTNGITAPSVESQIELERSIYQKFDIDPSTISCVEAHGTGTKLGDPIELEALAAAFGENTGRKNYCALGSVKSNIGHTASAAGVASVLKVLLALRHRTLVPTLNVTKENSHFDFGSSPFYVSRERQPWEVAPETRRRAAVSSFGYSGTNAHLVMEEYVPPLEQAAPAGEHGLFIVPLSARTQVQLQDKARDLMEFIRASHAGYQAVSSRPLDIGSIAYTLQLGREAMEERAGFVVSSVAQLAAGLDAYLDGEKGLVRVRDGRSEPDASPEAVDDWIARKEYSKLLQLWTRGLAIDWNKLYGAVRPRRVSLPTYPFSKERYWIDKVAVTQPHDEEFADMMAASTIEDILRKIGDEAMEADHAVRLLKTLV